MSDRVGEQYPFFQLAKALEASDSKKAEKWKSVLAGMRLRELDIGSRTPVAGMPAWATPEIARGGFATGAFAAGGALRSHEEKLASELSIHIRDVIGLRLALNKWHISEPGVAHLRDMARTGKFEAQTPEETALLAVSILSVDHQEDCDTILEAITPYFDRLRFFPTPTQHPRGEAVHVRNVGQLRMALNGLQPSANILHQSATLTIWLPLYDRLVDLLSEPDSETWSKHAKCWLDEYEAADKQYVSRRWTGPNGPFQRCRVALERRLSHGSLTDSQSTYVKLVVARRKEKYGTGTTRDVYRSNQARQNVDVRFDAAAQVMLHRLQDFQESDGIEDMEAIVASVSDTEAVSGAEAGSEMPYSIVRKTTSARVARISELVEDGQICSPEVLASVLPQITASLHASGFSDGAFRNVFSNLYRSFRRRRSVLLLDLQNQVQMEELPWASALLALRGTSTDDAFVSGEALKEIAALCLTHFPHVQFPNALIEEMLRLSQRAQLKLPLTRELAADIFMGQFSKPFEQAAEIAIQRYQSSLYGRYYALPQQIAPGDLGEICAVRAGITRRGNWSVAGNGMIIEQQLILTTHGLAPLFARVEFPGLDFAAMSRQCFEWICRRHRVRQPNWHSELLILKNSAYAWRQMLVYLSELPEKNQDAAFTDIEGHYARQPDEFRRRFDPAIIGLRQAMVGQSPDTNGGQIFLGWSLGKHPFS